VNDILELVPPRREELEEKEELHGVYRWQKKRLWKRRGTVEQAGLKEMIFQCVEGKYRW